MTPRYHVTSVVLLVLAICSAAPAESVSALLEEALYTEQTVGDLKAAMRIYEQLIAHKQAKADQKAQAQFRLGMCHMKKQQHAEAIEAFRTVLRKYPDQTELVAAANLRLARLTSPNPAALMPPNTVAYLEIGSPGRQIERIVNMLKGTPLENPLAVLGGVPQPTTTPTPPSAPSPRGPSVKSPADILAALLNPSMLEEFKKIRGLAVGLPGLRVGGGQQPQPLVVVVYPGESDALRGILIAALTMFANPAEPIEGMQTVTMPGNQGVGCAYDDNVMIIASPLDQLTWSVKQYKDLTDEPSLATEDFARSRSIVAPSS